MSPINDELEMAVLEELEGMTDEQIEAEARKVLAQKAKQAEYRKNVQLSPDAIEKRKLYRQKKYLREKALLAKAKELGIA